MPHQTRKRDKSSSKSNSNEPKKKKPRNRSSKQTPSSSPTIEEDSCPICLLPLNFHTRTNLFTGINCNHFFHASCIEQWCENYDCKCPLCRKHMFQVIHSPLTLDEIIQSNARVDTPPPILPNRLEHIQLPSSTQTQTQTPSISILQILYIGLSVCGREVSLLGHNPSSRDKIRIYQKFQHHFQRLEEEETSYYQVYRQHFPWRQKVRQKMEEQSYTPSQIRNALEKIKLALRFKHNMDQETTRRSRS